MIDKRGYYWTPQSLESVGLSEADWTGERLGTGPDLAAIPPDAHATWTIRDVVRLAEVVDGDCCFEAKDLPDDDLYAIWLEAASVIKPGCFLRFLR